MFPSAEEIHSIMAATGLDVQMAIGYWQDQQTFDLIDRAMDRQRSITYSGLSDAGKRFADDLRSDIGRAQASAWR